MYTLYLDESGITVDLGIDSIYIEGKSSRFLTIGGIIVSDENKHVFNKEYDRIISTYFNCDLPKNFKLHYEELRNAHIRKKDSVYKNVIPLRKQISDEMFNIIKMVDCSLISVSTDIKGHCERYREPVNIFGYALYLLLERFQYFLEAGKHMGKVVYEKYNNRLKHTVHKVHTYFKYNNNFPTYTAFKNIIGNITSGNPVTDTLLSYADFFVYTPWIKCESCCTRRCRYDEIKHKYFNLDHSVPRLRGNVEI